MGPDGGPRAPRPGVVRGSFVRKPLQASGGVQDASILRGRQEEGRAVFRCCNRASGSSAPAVNGHAQRQRTPQYVGTPDTQIESHFVVQKNGTSEPTAAP